MFNFKGIINKKNVFLLLGTLFSYQQILASESYDTNAYNLKFDFYDRSKLEGLDRSFIQQTQEKLDDLNKRLNADIKDLVTLSDHSKLVPIGIQKFMSSIRNYEESQSLMQSRIKSTILLPNFEKIDFSAWMSHYETMVTDTKKTLQELVFSISLPSGELYSQQGLDLSTLSTKNLFTAEQINVLTGKESQLRIMPTIDLNRINTTYNLFTLNKMRAFIQTFGASQKYRTQKNELALERALQDMQEAFWTRSYLRATFGIKIGSFGVNYTKRYFNLDFFGSTHVDFTNHFFFDENELMKMQDLAYNALSTQTGKSLPVLKGDTPFFSRISSALTYFSGNSQEAQANQLVLILLVADIEEELLLGRPDGLKSVREHYRSRYFSNEQNKIYYRKLAQKYLPQPSSEDRDDEADVQTIDARTLIGTFRMCVQSLENFELRLHEANGIKKTIEFLTKDNLVKQSRQRRNRDL